MESMFQTDEYLPLRDVVFKTLRKGILTGELKPGERLMEIHLANKLGVSRTPIREAIRKLELEGLVTMIPRKGAEVAQITPKSMQDVLEVRKVLDSLSVELACKRIGPKAKEQLGRACEDFERAVESGDFSAIALADVEFHDIIVEATGNMRLAQMVNNLAEQMYRYRFEYIKDVKMHSQLVAEHRQIYEGIIQGNEEAAKKAIDTHIDNQERSILQQISMEKEK
ncbi:MAG: GntR family transcriptional regulator [Lachnospiraceae bacterium]